MSNTDPKLVKVELEYADGEINRLTGKDAEEWLSQVNSWAGLAYAHGFSGKLFKWEVISPPVDLPVPSGGVPSEGP